MKQFPNSTAFGIFFAATSILIWGITFVNTKYLLGSFSALEILLLRFLMAYGALWLAKPHRLHLKKKSDEIYFMLAGLAGVTVYQFIENLALSYTAASNVSIIVSITPVFTAILTQLIFKEKHVTFTFLLGFLLAMGGIALVSFNGAVVFHFSPKGDFLALAAAICWAFYSLCMSKINSLSLPRLESVRRMFFWALVWMIPLVITGIFRGGEGHQTTINLNPAVNGERFSHFLNWFNLAFLGLGASAYCFAAWAKACNILGTVRTTVGLYLNSVVTIIFAAIFLGERITLMGGIGAALTITGLIIAEKRK